MSVPSHVVDSHLLSRPQRNRVERSTPHQAQENISPGLQRINPQPRIHQPLNQLLPRYLGKGLTVSPSSLSNSHQMQTNPKSEHAASTCCQAAGYTFHLSPIHPTFGQCQRLLFLSCTTRRRVKPSCLRHCWTIAGHDHVY